MVWILVPVEEGCVLLMPKVFVGVVKSGMVREWFLQNQITAKK
jgi:hypothetical protein